MRVAFLWHSLKLVSFGLTALLCLQAYTGLKTLYLECNAIADIEGLDALVNLRCLYLGKNLIHEITGLDNLIQLESLDLSENDIRRVEGLSSLSKLKFLSLAGVSINFLYVGCLLAQAKPLYPTRKFRAMPVTLRRHLN